jgi:hypothetical protein
MKRYLYHEIKETIKDFQNMFLILLWMIFKEFVKKGPTQSANKHFLNIWIFRGNFITSANVKIILNKFIKLISIKCLDWNCDLNVIKK